MVIEDLQRCTEGVLEIRSFEDLDVWKIAKELVLKVYNETTKFPKEELFGITSQMKRAVLSVPANIAEGFGRYHYLDKAKFYLNSRGSLLELKSFVLIALELNFINGVKAEELIKNIDDLGVKLNNLIASTKRKATKQSL